MSEKVALVTGGGSGIGRAVALELAAAGFAIAVNDINKEAGEETLDALGGRNRDTFYGADISDSGRVKEMFRALDERYGRLDVLVNNAGVPGRFSLLADMGDQTWERTIGVHLNGSFFCLRAAAGMMLPAKRGRIINMASIAGLNGTVGSGEYGAAKAGVINLTRTAAKEMGAYGITVNAIAPGMVATPVNTALREKGSPFIETAEDSTPTGRMTTPEEIAGLVVFLTTETAANITGQVIVVDGAAEISMSMDKFMHSLITRKSETLTGKEDGR